MAIFDGLRNMFTGGKYETEAERADELQEQSDALWGDVLDQQPGMNDLMGLDAFAGQTPQEYIDEHLAEQGVGGGFGREGGFAGGSRGAGLAQRLRTGGATQDAREQWLQEQIANDPFFGLQQLGTPEMAGAAADPAAIRAQRDMLRQMQDIVRGGGYTDAERGQMQMLQRDAAMGERAQRLAVQQQAAARGMGGGGMELMGALAAQQGGANRANDFANQTAVAAQQRMLQAMQMRGDMGTQMRSQSFDEDAQRRRAQDAFNMYNVGAQNDWTRYRGDTAQQQYRNLMDATAGASGQYNASAARADQQAAQDAAQTQQIISMVATGAGYAAGGPAGGAAAGQVAGAMGRQGGAGATVPDIQRNSGRGGYY